MQVLVNATTLVKGGGIQVAASFIVESCREHGDIEWHYAVSPQIAGELDSLGARAENLTVFTPSPTRDKTQRKRLLDLEKQLQPDVIFSVFGPAYMRFNAPHLCGVAVGWVTHSTWLAFSALSGWVARTKTFLMCLYKGFWLRCADRWVVEAENARQGLCRRVRVPLQKIDVVQNTCAAVFVEADVPPAKLPEKGEVVRLLYVSAYYPHKNIEFIPDVAAEMQREAPELDFEFVITLPEDERGYGKVIQKARTLGVESRITNVGQVSLNEVIELYRTAHICFMPSLLETFSATYPEAMALGRPIVTTDLDFAHATCSDAAIYFSAGDPQAAANAVLGLIGDPVLWACCLSQGQRVLSELPDAQTKFRLYVEAIRATAVAGRH